MPIEITEAYPPTYKLEVGDVVMVHKELHDQQTKRPFIWKFFAAVTS
jgi:protein involved in polysaccharide export with SLBB domain